MYKILIVGDQGSEKTELVNCFANKSHDLAHTPTIAVDFALKIIKIDDRPI